jgi:hypothetical protein
MSWSELHPCPLSPYAPPETAPVDEKFIRLGQH